VCKESLAYKVHKVLLDPRDLMVHKDHKVCLVQLEFKVHKVQMVYKELKAP
jgi:hypothetical protein